MENKITIYRGSHQIGGSVAEIRTKNHRIVIDFGENLPDSDTDDVIDDETLARTVFDGTPCDGVLFTHYHGDHIGMYKNIPQGVPLYLGSTAKKVVEILTQKLDFIRNDKGLPRIKGIVPYIPGKKLTAFGDIQVTPFVVDHSALDAYMFLIEAGGKRILYTGDFRDHGIAGQNDRLKRAIDKYIGEVDILVTEGTMLSRTEEAKQNPIQTEADLGKRARELFESNKESVILVSSTNLDSIMEFYHALPPKMGFVCDSYQAKLILLAMKEKGKYYPEYRPKMVDGKPRCLHIVDDMEGLGAEQNCCKACFSKLGKDGFTMLARESNPRFAKIMAGFPNTDPLIIYSKWTGYLAGKHENKKIKDFIGNHRMEVLHTSGHAYVETIEKVIRLTNPKVIIPMHTECADKFSSIPAFAPYKNRIKVLQDGEPFVF